MVFYVKLTNAEDGWVVAECPALPGCVSQGKDQQEALANIKERSLLGYGLRIRKQFGMPRPASLRFS